MKNKILYAAFTIIVLAACSSKKDPEKNNPRAAPKNLTAAVEGFITRQSTISNNIEVPGNLMPYEFTELHPEVSGRLVQLNIKEGSNVAKGTLLAKVFDGDLQAQLKKLQVQLSISEKTVQRQGELLKISGISQQEYDLSGLDVNNIRADIDVIQTEIRKTEIRAPFSGRLGLRNISLGAYITPLTIVTTIQQVEQLKLEFTIPEKYTSDVSTGQVVTFGIEGNNKKHTAKVIATEATVTENNRSLRMRAVVTSKDRNLIPGAFAKVTLNFGKDNEALMIPSQAIIPGARNKQVVLYKNGIAKFTVVGTGLRDSSKVQITSGISAGDTIVTTGILSIKPDAKIKISRISNAQAIPDAAVSQRESVPGDNK